MSKKEFFKIAFYIVTSLMILFSGLQTSYFGNQLLLQMLSIVMLNFYFKNYTTITDSQRKLIIFWLYLLFISVWFSLITFINFKNSINIDPFNLNMLSVAIFLGFIFSILTNNDKIIKLLAIALSAIFLIMYIYYSLCNFEIILESKERYFYQHLAKMLKSNRKDFMLKDLTNFNWTSVGVTTSNNNHNNFINFCDANKHEGLKGNPKCYKINIRQDICRKIFDGKGCKFLYNKSYYYNSAKIYLTSKVPEDNGYIFINLSN